MKTLCVSLAMAPFMRGQFLYNINEQTLATLNEPCYECPPEDIVEIAKFTSKTAWVETGYSHAREYTLDFVMTVDTIEEMSQGRVVFWYISWPYNEPIKHRRSELSYETIFAKYNPKVDLRIQFLSTELVDIRENTNPVFTNYPNKLDQELIKGYKAKSYNTAVPEYVGWDFLVKQSVEEKTRVSFQMTRPQKYVPIKAGTGV